MSTARVLNLMMVSLVVAFLALPVCAADIPTEPSGARPLLNRGVSCF
jgi:hypothetical protein